MSEPQTANRLGNEVGGATIINEALGEMGGEKRSTSRRYRVVKSTVSPLGIVFFGRFCPAVFLSRSEARPCFNMLISEVDLS